MLPFLPAAEGYPAVLCQFPRHRTHRLPSPTPTSRANSITAHQKLARRSARALLNAACRARGRLSAKTASAPPLPVNNAHTGERSETELARRFTQSICMTMLISEEEITLCDRCIFPVNSAQPLLPGRHKYSAQPKIPSEEEGVKEFSVQERPTRR